VGGAPFAGLSRRLFEGVLDMLSGRYPSDEFAELRPRITWDRLGHKIRAREVRVLDERKQQLGVMSLNDALRLAQGKGLDLVEIAPTATPVISMADTPAGADG
jgi:Lhr-like helicase